MSQYETEYETSLTDPELEEPQLYEVLLLNDDYTTMPFVIEVLQRFFHKNYDEAEKLMYTVHEKGSAVCAIYPKEIAETRVQQVIDYARENGHPLMSVLRPH
ncbi:ATP-dependent Clp protease adapter ClpS [Suttonella ornithocola]|uniref:ATP-dependent Clp protease adapter protein ClpS n=1 Tax=Suttonella ornithocola TaxID=279832 RepID=A0A380MLN2_9GAMM|nr:ATP-dependent Clp protease adapter ClpS [Suttonella ornithocola]SUO93158.1 ATP-dependent Clp protease adapter protein ClpS [Suttonella ornithocola]